MNAKFLSNRIFWLNLAFWMLFFCYKFYDWTAHMTPWVAFIRIGIPMFFHIVLSYTHYFFILPDLLKTKRLSVYFSRLIPTIGLVMFFQVMAENQWLAQYSMANYYDHFTWLRFVSTLWDQMSFMIFTGMIKFAADWFELENKKKELENQKLNAELNYLKAQINPHFLFNTLHNLNYLTQAKKEQATEVVIKLSNIMRYMIYESNKAKVRLGKEIEYVKDYLDLESIRLNNRFDIKFDTSRVTEELDVAPLILIPFVENAFKHGVSDRHPESWIKIILRGTKSNLELEVMNSVFDQKTTTEESGFGLDNVKKRLHLSYPDKHQLEIEESDNQFRIWLKLDLS